MFHSFRVMQCNFVVDMAMNQRDHLGSSPSPSPRQRFDATPSDITGPIHMQQLDAEEPTIDLTGAFTNHRVMDTTNNTEPAHLHTHKLDTLPTAVRPNLNSEDLDSPIAPVLTGLTFTLKPESIAAQLAPNLRLQSAEDEQSPILPLLTPCVSRSCGAATYTKNQPIGSSTEQDSPVFPVVSLNATQLLLHKQLGRLVGGDGDSTGNSPVMPEVMGTLKAEDANMPLKPQLHIAALMPEDEDEPQMPELTVDISVSKKIYLYCKSNVCLYMIVSV